MESLKYKNILNILHYFIWLDQIRFCRILEKFIDNNNKFFNLIYCSCFRIKYENKTSACKHETDKIFYNKKTVCA